MATWKIFGLKISTGTFTVIFSKDNGDSTDYTLSGTVISYGKCKRVVEESGYGGNLRFSEVEIEIVDVDGTLSGTIFSDDLQVTLQVILNDGSDHSAFIGIVDLSTVKFKSYYDDGASTEYHSCSFVAFDIIKRLEAVDVGTIRGNLDSVKLSKDIAAPFYNSENFAGQAVNDTAPVSGHNWLNQYFATTPDAVFAHVSLGPGQHSFHLMFTNFGFNVPSTHTVVAIQATVHRRATGTGTITDNAVKLIIGGVVTGSDKSDASIWSSTEETMVYNTAFDDTWGTSPTYSDVNATTFGLAISAKNTAGVGVSLAEIDYVMLAVHAKSTSAGPYYFVKMVDVFKELQNAVGLTVDATDFENNVAETFKHLLQTGDGDTQEGTFSDLYMMYQKTDLTGYLGLWDDSTDGSFFGLNNALALLMALSGQFLGFPVFFWDAVGLSGHLKLKQRTGGDALSASPAKLMASSETRFFGYDAVKVVLSTNKDGIIYTFRNSQEYTVSFSSPNPVWDNLSHKFEMTSYFRTKRVNLPNQVGDDFEGNFLYLYNSDTGQMVAVNQVFNSVVAPDQPAHQRTRNNYLRFLVRAMQIYWQDTKTLERTYDNAGISSPAVELLNTVTVDSIDYAVAEHEFDIINNEMNLKLVSY